MMFCLRDHSLAIRTNFMYDCLRPESMRRSLINPKNNVSNPQVPMHPGPLLSNIKRWQVFLNQMFRKFVYYSALGLLPPFTSENIGVARFPGMKAKATVWEEVYSDLGGSESFDSLVGGVRRRSLWILSTSAMGVRRVTLLTIWLPKSERIFRMEPINILSNTPPAWLTW